MLWKEILVSLIIAAILSWIVGIVWPSTILAPPVFIASWIILYYYFKKHKGKMPI